MKNGLRFLVSIDVDEKMAHYLPSFFFGYVRLIQLEYYFSCFGIFFLLLLLFFSSHAIYFKLLNALYSKFERLNMSGRIFVQLQLDVPGWGESPLSGSSKTLNF